MDDATPPKKAASGAPPWVMTFADLMSLLMCFFVLLLSFSEMDVLKFKQLAGSMKDAFGVQRLIKAKEIPKGTSVIAHEFSPGKPTPTALAVVRQQTTADLQRQLRVNDRKADGGESVVTTSEGAVAAPRTPVTPRATVKEVPVPAPPAPPNTSELREALAAELASGALHLGTEGQRIVIRIQEKGSFPSGRADLLPQFAPVLERIGQVLKRIPGQVVIAGYTDDVPIHTRRFRSNWELSAARAVTVLHHLAKIAGIGHDRFMVEGHADTHPLVPNDSAENRARNRRVEIVIIRGDDHEAGQLAATTVDPTGAETGAGAPAARADATAAAAEPSR